MAVYQKAATQYAEKLAGYSEEEEQLAAQLAEQQRIETERRMQETIRRAQADAAGIGAAYSDPSRLRGASYAQGQVGQQGVADRELLRQLEEQAARERMLGVYGRRGEYGTEGAGAYSGALGLEEIARARQEREDAERMARQQQQEAAQLGWAGLAASATGAGLGAMASDRRLKRDIASAPGEDEDELAAAAVGHTYRYKAGAASKEARAPAGDRYGPMAQDLAASKLGRSLVIRTPKGLAVDAGAASLASLSLAGRLGRRVDELEERLAAGGRHGR